MRELRVIVAGSRGFNDYEYLRNSLLDILESKSLFDIDGVRVISGGAEEVDKLGERFANECAEYLTVIPANWDADGSGAGYKRNIDMLNFATEDNHEGMLVAFWDGKSRGIKHMINIAEDEGIDVYIRHPRWVWHNRLNGV